jgi:Flp pilus assembly protein TadB
MSALWADQCGIMMMVTAAIMMVIGYFIIRRVVAIEV